MSVSRKIVDGLTRLFEGYVELREGIERDFATESTEPDEDLLLEADAVLVTEVRAAMETVMDAEDITSDELASLLSTAKDAMEEIDPDAFADFDDEEEERMPF